MNSEVVKAPTEGELPFRKPPPTVPPMEILICGNEEIAKVSVKIRAKINLVCILRIFNCFPEKFNRFFLQALKDKGKI
jgi:hypothetical protein